MREGGGERERGGERGRGSDLHSSTKFKYYEIYYPFFAAGAFYAD